MSSARVHASSLSRVGFLDESDRRPALEQANRDWVEDSDENKRILIPEKASSTKQTWVTFYNAEAAEGFKPKRKDGDERVFQTSKQPLNRKFRHVSEDTGVKITVQKLRH